MTIFLVLRNYFAIHGQNVQNLAIEMFKAINDLSTHDFSELFQLNVSLYGFRSNEAQKLLFSISILLDLVKVLFGTLVQWSGILYQQKLPMLILCHLFRINLKMEAIKLSMEAIKLSVSALCRLFGWNWF